MIRGLGVQTTTSSGSYFSFSFGREEQTRFIPSSSIQDIWIHEAFRGFGVRFYLCIVVEGEEDVVVVFPVSLHSTLFTVFFISFLSRSLSSLLDVGCLSIYLSVRLSVCLSIELVLLTSDMRRVYYHDERFWNRCGEERGLVCTSRRRELTYVVV